MTNFLSGDLKRPIPTSNAPRPPAPQAPVKAATPVSPPRSPAPAIPSSPAPSPRPTPSVSVTPARPVATPISPPRPPATPTSSLKSQNVASGGSAPLARGELETEKPPKPKRPPSRFWAEYYGPVFLLLVAVFIVAGFFLLRPLILQYKQLRADASAASLRLEGERGYLDSLLRSIAAAQTIPPETLADVDEALPRDIGVPKLLETLSRLAEADKIRLSSIQFSASKAGVSVAPTAGGAAQVAGVDISLSVEAPDYAATRRFLNAIERNLRVFDIQTIAVSSDPTSGRQTYSIQLRTYTFSLPSVTTPTSRTPSP